MTVRLVGQDAAGGPLYVLRTNDPYPGTPELMICRLYDAETDTLSPLKLPGGSYANHMDLGPVLVSDAERERIEARVTALTEAETA